MKKFLCVFYAFNQFNNKSNYVNAEYYANSVEEVYGICKQFVTDGNNEGILIYSIVNIINISTE